MIWLDGGLLLELGQALVAGLALGLLYYGGLWLTVRRLPQSSHPGPLFLSSFVLRTVVAMAGLFVIARASWIPLALAMVGFLVVRIVLVRRLGPDDVHLDLSAGRRRNHGAQS